MHALAYFRQFCEIRQETLKGQMQLMPSIVQ